MRISLMRRAESMHAWLAQVAKLATAAGAMKAVPLAVSGAFHTALMQPAREALVEVTYDHCFQPITEEVAASSCVVQAPETPCSQQLSRIEVLELSCRGESPYRLPAPEEGSRWSCCRRDSCMHECMSAL